MHGPTSTVKLFSSSAAPPPEFEDLRLRCAAHQAVLVLRAFGRGQGTRQQAQDAAAWLEASLDAPDVPKLLRSVAPRAPRGRPVDELLDGEVREANRLVASCPGAHAPGAGAWIRAAALRLASLASCVHLGRMQFALDLAGRESFAKGLAWYASHTSYDGHGRPGEAGDESGEFELDLGERARLILAMIGET